MYKLDYQDYLIGLIVGLPGLTYWINCWITWINICWSDVQIGLPGLSYWINCWITRINLLD